MIEQRLPVLIAATAIGFVWSPAASGANFCPAPWLASAIYASPGNLVSENGLVYRNNWWTSNDDPVAHNGVYPGSGQPWTNVGACGSCVSAPPTPAGLAASATTSASTTLSWGAVTAPSCVVTGYNIYQNGALLGTVAGASVVVSNLNPATSYSFSVAAVDAAGASAKSQPITVTTQAAGGGGGGGGGGGSSQSVGAIYFHLWLGVGAAQDSLTLTGGNYDDLILSNVIAGVMYSHLVKEGFPGVQFDNDYLVGSIFAQLLQENIQTQLYQANSNLIDPSPDQQAVMGVGQGGPYQINNYSADMVSGNYTADGHSLINYVAIQKNIGFTVAGAVAQHALPTPASFNDKYYGPMLPAFFHYNDLVALAVTGKGPGGWMTPWEPAFDAALETFKTLPHSFLDVIANAAYNQGYYGPLVTRYSKLGATATAATIASVNSYSAIWGSSDTYSQYPYQVHYYLDQLYDNPIPTTSLTTITTPQNHVVLGVGAIASVFSRVVQTLDYSTGGAPAKLFTADQATAAFAASLTKNAVSSTASFDLGKASSRAVIFAVIDDALSGLETATGMKFNATTLSQL